jgi:hypothetical protein
MKGTVGYKYREEGTATRVPVATTASWHPQRISFFFYLWLDLGWMFGSLRATFLSSECGEVAVDGRTAITGGLPVPTVRPLGVTPRFPPLAAFSKNKKALERRRDDDQQQATGDGIGTMRAQLTTWFGAPGEFLRRFFVWLGVAEYVSLSALFCDMLCSRVDLSGGFSATDIPG